MRTEDCAQGRNELSKTNLLFHFIKLIRIFLGNFYINQNQSIAVYRKNNWYKSFSFEKKKLHLQRCEGNKTAKGAIAQLVEQRTENPCVAGSNPAGTTKI